MEGNPVADLEMLPLGRTLKQVADIGMEAHEVAAAANATIGLSALASTNAPLPLSIIEEWQGYLNQIRTSCRNPLPPRDKGLRVYEDGWPG